VFSRRAAVAGEMRQASPICSAMPRPIASGCTPAASCSATWDCANLTDSAACNAAVAARSFSNRVSRSIRAKSATAEVSATTAASSSRISSRRAANGSAAAGPMASSPSADMPETLLIATDKNRMSVRSKSRYGSRTLLPPEVKSVREPSRNVEGVRDNMTRSQMDLHVRSFVCAQFGTTGKDQHGMS
jgi:hypothetical protein